MSKRRRLSITKLAELEDGHREILPLCERFATELSHQLNALFAGESIALSFPLQQRVKTWISIAEKLERKTVRLDTISDLSDLIGLRVILQFRRDVDRVCNLLDANFHVLEHYNSGDRLREDQFGYSSVHFIVAMPEAWLSVPTLKQMGALRAEIQVRTTAQHIWAAASHTLQYKHEKSVPLPIRRTIHRVSALLETVDLEFDRVLEERQLYVERLAASGPDEPLNVDSLRALLTERFPPENATSNEYFAELLEDLQRFDVTTRGRLEGFLSKYAATVVEEDKKIVATLRSAGNDEEAEYRTSPDRIEHGVFFTHVGLARQVMEREFGARWIDYMNKVRAKYE